MHQLPCWRDQPRSVKVPSKPFISSDVVTQCMVLIVATPDVCGRSGDHLAVVVDHSSCVVVVIGMSPRTGPRHRNVRSWAAHAAIPARHRDDLAVGRQNRGAADSALHPPVNGQVIAINLTPATCGCAASRGLGERGAGGPGPRQWAGSGHSERARGCGVEPARVRRRCPCAVSAAVFTSGEVGENRLDEFGSLDASDDAQSGAAASTEWSRFERSAAPAPGPNRPVGAGTGTGGTGRFSVGIHRTHTLIMARIHTHFTQSVVGS